MMGYEIKKAQNAPLCDIELLMKSIENFIFCSSHGATSDVMRFIAPEKVLVG